MVADRLRQGLQSIADLGAGALRSGVLHPVRPDRALRLPLPLVRYGTTPATLGALAALRFPGRAAVIDEAGTLTFGELERRAASLATALSAMVTTAPVIRPGTAGSGGPSRIGIMCRNHRGFVIATLAGSRLGHDVVFLNTEFSAPQLAGVLHRERVGLLVLDEEFVDVADAAEFTGPRVIAWYDRPAQPAGARAGDPAEAVAGDTGTDVAADRGEVPEDLTASATGGAAGRPARGTIPTPFPAYPTIDELVGMTPPASGRPTRVGKLIILTSGTTGAPKGAQHDLSLRALVPPAIAHAMTIPLRSREPMLIAPPLYHVLGLGYLNVALALGAPVVLLRGFTPGAALAAIGEHRVRALVAVPLMLQRILEHIGEPGRSATANQTGDPTRAEPAGPTPDLRVVVSGGSPLLPSLARRFTGVFGPVLYNVFGATETGWATIATPEDLREAPGTVGRVSWGVTLKLLDEAGQEVPRGEIGQVFFGGGGIDFAGYTGGGDKETSERLVATGDLGHFDEAGRLFIDGRVDDMIVSGGENVFPGEVEDLLAGHPDVGEVAVTGVDDQEFGQRLVAHVVRAPGSAVTGEQLRAYVRQQLARYKVPREVLFVDELPRTTTGKIRHAQLRER